MCTAEDGRLSPYVQCSPAWKLLINTDNIEPNKLNVLLLSRNQAVILNSFAEHIRDLPNREVDVWIDSWNGATDAMNFPR